MIKNIDTQKDLTNAEPCPFCGGKRIEIKALRSGYGTKLWGYYVRCKTCGVSTSTMPTAEAAENRWNERVQ